MNYKSSFIHFVENTDTGIKNTIIKNQSILPSESQSLDEVIIIKLDDFSVKLIEKKYLINDKKLVINGHEVFVEIGDERHSVNELSSGERHILTFLALVLFEGQGRDFLVIDEPEISLNIKWQRELMALFAALLPSTQIIVASHSPALAKRNPNYLSELKVWRD